MSSSKAEMSGSGLKLQTALRCFQYHPSIPSHDAIGNSIRTLDRMLRQRGIKSWMVCDDAHLSQSKGGVRPLSSIVGMGWRPSDVLLLHYSFYTERLSQILSLPVRKVLVYHNVTPPHFFRRSEMDYLANLAEMSLIQISEARDLFDLVVGVSAFNLAELPDVGPAERLVIPVFYQEAAFTDCLVDRKLYFELKERGDTVLLFIGRFVPNKRHDKLIEVLAEMKKSAAKKATLHLVGKIWNNEYYLEILSKAASLGVLGDLRIYPDASQEVVCTLFAAADAFVSMSEHEGFMVPVVEAFAAGCPVVAQPTTAVGETMGEAGLKVVNGLATTASALIEMLSIDKQLRLEVVAEQAARALDFRGCFTFNKWIDVLRRLQAIEEVSP